MPDKRFVIYLLVTAGVTYLVRMLPLVLMKGRIKNRFILSFLHYIPYAVLTVMTIPAIFYAAENIWACVAGFAVAMLLAYKGRSLVQVAAAACTAVLVVSAIF